MDQEILAPIPLFATLDPGQRSELAALLRPRTARAHETVFWIGDSGSDFYIIQVGRCSVTCPDERGREMVLAELEAGNFFGEISLLDDGPRSATVRAESDCQLLSLSRPDFLRFLERHPSAAVHVIAVLGHRQRDMLDKLRGLSNANRVADERQTWGQRFADAFATLMGSWSFIIVQSVLWAAWIFYNAVPALRPYRFDEPPFVLLNLVLAFFAAYAAPIIMMSQNRQGEKDRIKADLDYQVNVKAQWEIMQLHQKLDRLTVALIAREGKGMGTPAAPTAVATEGSGGGAAGGVSTPPSAVGSGSTGH